MCWDALPGVAWQRWDVRNQHRFPLLITFMVNGKTWSRILFYFSITYLHVLNWLQWEYSIKKKKSCSKSSTESVKMPWDSQRLKMGKKGAENIPLSFFCLTAWGNELSAIALNAVPLTSHQWVVPTSEGEPNKGFAGLRAVTGESREQYASAALS